MVRVTFIQGDRKIQVDAHEGQTVLDIKHSNDINLECACEGSLACSTCHVVVQNADFYNRTIEITPISDDENDMLDLAYGLTKTSRLGCQLKLSRELDGIVLIIPEKNRNSSHARAYED